MSTAGCRRTLSLLGSLVMVTAVVALVPRAAEASSRQLVALGDSYASGVGTRAYFPASGTCKRSPYAYPVRDAHRLGASLSFAACAGATVDRVLHDQVPRLAAETTDVTLTVGGNDAGFGSVMLACAEPRSTKKCYAAIKAAKRYISTTLPKRLDRLYAAVRRHASDAHVVVVGYPRLFNGEDCNAGTWFSPGEERRLNATADLLDQVSGARSTAAGFDFADPRSAFARHAICAAHEWVNGLSWPLEESYHPNRRGQRSFAALVYRNLG